MSEFEGGGFASEALSEGSVRFVECEVVLLQRARNPDSPAFVPEVSAHFAHHRGDGKGQEVAALAQVEALDGVHQAETCDLDEVFVGLPASAVPGSDVVGNRQT